MFFKIFFMPYSQMDEFIKWRVSFASYIKRESARINFSILRTFLASLILSLNSNII